MKTYIKMLTTSLLFISLTALANDLEMERRRRANILLPFIEKEDLQGLHIWLIASSISWVPSHSAPSQDDKNEALCYACSAHPRDNDTIKILAIKLLLEEGALKSSLKGGKTPLEIVEYHQVWYQQRGKYEELVTLLSE